MDNKFMNIALSEAKKAYSNNDVPVGAVIVKNGIVLSKAHNKKEKTGLPTSHAEIIAIEKACKKLNDWRLNGCVMYVTLEPCFMCTGALVESRIDKVIYAADNVNKKTYSDCADLFIKDFETTEECEKMLKSFFQTKRK